MQTAPQGSGHRLYASYFHESSWGIWSDKSLCLEIVRNETCAVSTGKRGLESIKCMKKKFLENEIRKYWPHGPERAGLPCGIFTHERGAALFLLK